MGILDIEIVKGFMRMCNDGWLQGWHERDVHKRQILAPVICTGVNFLPGNSSGSMAATPTPSRCTQ